MIKIITLNFLQRLTLNEFGSFLQSGLLLLQIWITFAHSTGPTSGSHPQRRWRRGRIYDGSFDQNPNLVQKSQQVKCLPGQMG